MSLFSRLTRSQTAALAAAQADIAALKVGVAALQAKVKTMSDNFAALSADVTALLAVVPTAISLISTLNAEVVSLRAAAGVDPNGAAELALDAQVKDGLAALQAAVTPAPAPVAPAV